MASRRNIVDDLRVLGDSSSSIKRRLKKARLRGTKDSAVSCPVANWLISRGWKGVAVDTCECIAYDGEDWDASSCKTPPPLANFIERFDQGLYPDLIGDWEPPKEK